MNQGMGCSVCLWLLISLGRVWGTGHGARELVLGTLGKATILRIPEDLQNLTKDFGEAVWKRYTEDPGSKLVLLKYVGGNYTSYVQGQTRFHPSDFSLELLNTSRQDRQLYEYIVSKGSVEKVWQIQLEVYEPVSDPNIQILSRVLVNSSCSITLNCTAKRGDNVTYSWGSEDTSTSELCSHNGSLLHLSYPLQNTSMACACVASNPISSQVVAFDFSDCSHEQGGSTGLRTEHLVLVVLVPIVVVLVLTGVFVTLHVAVPLAGQEQERSPLAQDSTVHTIYSQVQRVQKQKGPPHPEPPSCTTIYAAATSLPLDTALAPSRPPQAPGSPSAELPALHGHPPLPQTPDKELTTVYASVMLPMA